MYCMWHAHDECFDISNCLRMPVEWTNETNKGTNECIPALHTNALKRFATRSWSCS